MASVYEYLPMDQRIHCFGNARIREIDEQMENLRREREMWKAIIVQQKLCEQCAGSGKIRVQVAQDESVQERCDVCRGTGIRS